MKNTEISKRAKKVDYSLSGVKIKERELENPIILKNVTLKVDDRDIRCMKGDCWRDCADCD